MPDYRRLGRITPAYVESIIDRSIRRLRVERLDLVQYYWWDPDGIPGFIETALWLTDLHRAGKIARVGISNFNTVQLEQLLETGVPMVTNQLQYSPVDLRPDGKLIPACRERGIVQLCYGTLAGGFFAAGWLGRSEPVGPFDNRSLTKYKLIIEDFGGWELFQELLRTLHAIAGKHGRSIPQVALRWVLDRCNVAAAIIGATSARHLAENVAVFDFALDEEDHAAVAAIIARREGPAGDCYDLERDKEGRHGRIMRYDQAGRDA